jgi:hypothetical protein
MQYNNEHYLEFLKQKQLIETYSSGKEDLNKLFFQDMVLENLTPQERERYMRFLLEPRPKNAREAASSNPFNDELYQPLTPQHRGLKGHFSRWGEQLRKLI